MLFIRKIEIHHLLSAARANCVPLRSVSEALSVALSVALSGASIDCASDLERLLGSAILANRLSVCVCVLCVCWNTIGTDTMPADAS